MQATLTTVQAAELLGIKPARVRQLAIAGELKGQKHGRDWIFRRVDVQAFAQLPRPVGRPGKTK